MNKNGFANIIEANLNEEKEARKNVIVSLDNQTVPTLNNSILTLNIFILRL